jgi:hypothetical protein
VEGTLPQVPKPDKLNAHAWWQSERLWCKLSKGTKLEEKKEGEMRMGCCGWSDEKMMGANDDDSNTTQK